MQVEPDAQPISKPAIDGSGRSFMAYKQLPAEPPAFESALNSSDGLLFALASAASTGNAQAAAFLPWFAAWVRQQRAN